MSILCFPSLKMYYLYHQLISQLKALQHQLLHASFSLQTAKKLHNLNRRLNHNNRTVIPLLFKMLQNGKDTKLGASTVAGQAEKKHYVENGRIIDLPTSESDVKAAATFAASKVVNGNIIGVPTDTVYGLACLVQNKTAIENLYSIKGRHPDKPVSICVGEIDDIYLWGDVTVPRDLLEQLLPGPVTLCFTRKPKLNVDFNPEAELVGIRIPDHLFVRHLCRQAAQLLGGCSGPLALTSANVSGSDSCLEVCEFSNALFQRPGNHLDAIFDGGHLGQTRQSRLGSTIVDLSRKGCYRIIRQGSAEQNTIRTLQKYGLLEKCCL